MSKILFIIGHPDLANDSVVTKEVVNILKSEFPQSTFSVLSELYKNFQIDVKAEQDKAKDADLIVFVYPIFWYGFPSLLERWVEVVFVHGFGHGSKGKVKGKKLIAAFTTGAAESFYTHEGAFKYTVEEFFEPKLKNLCGLCEINYCGYVFTGGVSYFLRTDPAKKEELLKAAKNHANKIIEKIKSTQKIIIIEQINNYYGIIKLI